MQGTEHDLSQGVLYQAIRTELANNYNLNEQPELLVPDHGGNYGVAYRPPAIWPNHEAMENCFIDLNKSFIYVGDNSIFQKRITMILSIQWISFTFLVMGMTYVFRAPVFFCLDGKGGKAPCSQEVACSNIAMAEIDYPSSISITQEFNLICDREYLAITAQSLLFLGGFMSGYIFSYMASKIGARSVLIITMIMATLSVLTCAFTTDYGVFLIGYFMIGFCMFGYETTVYDYITDISAIRFRTISVNILTIVWAGAPIFFPIVSLIPSWRTTFIGLSLPMLVSLPFMYKYFLESPRFLVRKRCFKQARQIFKEISITNRRPPYGFRLQEEMEFENRKLTRIKAVNPDASISYLQASKEKMVLRTYNYLDLFRYKSLLKITVNMMVFWMVRFYVYFGLTLGLETIGKSGSFLTYAISLSALSQVLGTFGIPIMTIFIFNRFKLEIMRKSILVVTICCILLWFVKIPSNCMKKQTSCNQVYYTVSLIVTIKFFITIFSTGLISYSQEVFPADIRSLGSGFCLTFGRLGIVILPLYINYMKIYHFGRNPISLLFPFTLLVYVMCYFLPDTEVDGMKDHIEQEETLKYRKSVFENKNLNEKLLAHNN